jgi:hypothetical protein
MALTLNSETTHITSLEEYKQHVSHDVNVRDLDSVCSSADQLKALANNKTFLTEYVNGELIDWKHSQLTNSYTAQTLVLGGGRDFLIRANIWMPPAGDPAARHDQKTLFFYERPHDHNFSFLTVGYFGPGYETTIYEYDSSQIHGAIGEKVHLRFLEKTTLPVGKIMLYRQSTDIHSQGHPTEFSISLNLLLSPADVNKRDQYLFDLESSKITQLVKNPTSSRLMMCRVARYIGNAHTASLLDKLAQTHTSGRVRLTAVESLAALEPSASRDIWQRAVGDSSPLVRDHARKQLESA